MAFLEALLRRMALSLEKSFASGEDLSRPLWQGAEEPAPDRDERVVLPGYGVDDDKEQPALDASWVPARETARAPAHVPGWLRQAEREPERKTAHTPLRERKPQTVQSPWSRSTPGSQEPPGATLRAPKTQRVQPTDRSPWDTVESRTTQPYAHASPTHAPLARIRARLDTPDALREAFVIREILDRPLARRRAR